jgi:hypothetical protein
MTPNTDSDERLYYRVSEVVALTGLSKGKIFAAIRHGDIQAKKLDGCLLLVPKSVEAWLERATPWRPRQDDTANGPVDERREATS